MRRLLPVLAALAVLALGTACSSTGGTASGPSSASPVAASDLLIQIHRGDGAPPESYRLTCGTTVTGSHPNARAACAHLAAMKNPFAPIPADEMCNQIYSGPQTAHVTGRWKGQPVDLKLSRVDGCRTAQWQRLGPLLPASVRAAPPS